MFRPKIYKRLRWFTSDELEMARSVSPMMLDCFETFGVCDINESFKIRSPETSTSNSKFIKIGSFSGCGKSGDIGFLSDDQKPGQIYIENKKSAELELISESLELLFIIVASEEIR